MQTEINMSRVKDILSGKPLEEPKRFLYFYSIYTFIDGDKASTLEEDQAADKLKEYPSMTVTYVHLQKTPIDPPTILKGRKGLETLEVTSHEALSDIIASKTGVRVQPEDLMPKQKESRSITQRAQAFMADVTRSQQTKNRILNQLKNR